MILDIEHPLLFKSHWYWIYSEFNENVDFF